MNRIKLGWFVCAIMLSFLANAQKQFFVYFQTEDYQPFYVQIGSKNYSSTASGYVVIPKLQSGDYDLRIGFPGGGNVQPYQVKITDTDLGYMVKSFGDKGWGLFNLQTADIQYANAIAQKRQEALLARQKEVADNLQRINAERVADSLLAVERAAEKSRQDSLSMVALLEKATQDSLALVVEAQKQQDSLAVVAMNAQKQMDSAAVAAKPPVVVAAVPLAAAVNGEKVTSEKAAVQKNGTEQVDQAKDQQKTGNTSAGKTQKEMPEAKTTVAEKPGVLPAVSVVPGAAMLAEDSAKNSKASEAKNAFPNQREEKAMTFLDMDFEMQSDSAKTGDVMINAGDSAGSTQATRDSLAASQPLSDTSMARQFDAAIDSAGLKTAAQDSLGKKDQSLTAVTAVAAVTDTLAVNNTVIEEKKATVVVPVAGGVAAAANTAKSDSINARSEMPEKTTQPAPAVLAVVPEPNNNSATLVQRQPCTFLATNADLDSLLAFASINSDMDEMVFKATKSFKLKCYTTYQLRKLGKVLASDVARYRILDAAYPFCADYFNYGELVDLFSQEYYAKRFKAMLEQ